jgi:hypothetical protein
MLLTPTHIYTDGVYYFDGDLFYYPSFKCQSQWPRALRNRSALRFWVRISPCVWMSVCCERCVLSGRDLCDELISRSEEFYRLWCIVVYDPETSLVIWVWPTGAVAPKSDTQISNTFLYTWPVKPCLVFIYKIVILVNFSFGDLKNMSHCSPCSS